MYLQIILMQFQCEPSIFPRTLYPEDSAQSIFFTQAGLSQYLNNLMNSGIWDIVGQKFPDIETTLNLGVTKVDMMLTDMIVSEFSVDESDIVLKNNNAIPIVLANCRFVIRFNWKIQQVSYPYMTDQGTGNVMVSDTDFSTLCSVNCDYETCPNHLLADILHADLTIGILKIVLEGGSSWMYQSMINLVMGVLHEEMQRVISHFMTNNLVDVLNNLFANYISYRNNEMDYTILKDERFVSPWVIGDGYGYILFSGYAYSRVNTSDEFITRDMLKEIVQNKFNAPFQLTVSEAAFNNYYYIYHKYQNAFSQPDVFQLLEPPVIEFLNSAAILTVKLSANGSKVELKMKGAPVYLNHPDQSHKLVVYFQFEKYEISSESDLNLEALQDQVLNFINYQMQNWVMYIMINSKTFDATQFIYILDSTDKVLRLIRRG
ncbi:Conserved_hypothetical protein [Hexamita inflata]|uniref:BPI-like protein n=1 Tax=Hexamita inflata TaxID=28002 RepID=A0AA86V5S0_9EUKA|nr:Conserved hypothetical protein [Hexamita inflata]